MGYSKDSFVGTGLRRHEDEDKGIYCTGEHRTGGLAMIHEEHIGDKSIFRKVVIGSKNYDARIYDYKRRLMLPNDVILFRCREICDENGGEKTIPVVIESMHIYFSFDDMFENISPKEFGFKNGIAKDEAVEYMEENIYGDDKEQLYNQCVVAIKFSRIAAKLDELERKYEEEKWIGNTRNIIDLR